jgi:hypothetical protein
MRRLLLHTAAGLCLASLVGLVQGSERAGTPGKGEGAACGSHGTTIDFVDSPAQAARQARKEGKLVFVLHVSGNFEDPRFT